MKLQSFLGCGYIYYGRKNFNPADKSYITTQWFVLLLIPIIPIATYRLIKDQINGSYNFYNIFSVNTNYTILNKISNIDKLQVIKTYLFCWPLASLILWFIIWRPISASYVSIFTLIFLVLLMIYALLFNKKL